MISSSGGTSEEHHSVRNHSNTLLTRSNRHTLTASTTATRTNIAIGVDNISTADPALIQDYCSSKTSHMNILTIDGQAWDVSNLSTISSASSSLHSHGNMRNRKIREVKRLYPQITADEEEIKREIEKTRKALLLPGGCERQKNPATMTLRSYVNRHHPQDQSDTQEEEGEERNGKIRGQPLDDFSDPFLITEDTTALLQATTMGANNAARPILQSEATTISVSDSNDTMQDSHLLHDSSLELPPPTEITTTRCDSFSFEDHDEEQLTLEVAPGVEVLLRGSAETRTAIHNWTILRAHCLECTVLLHCIEDAEYLLCPLCRCVSPLALCVNTPLTAGAYGVGLGFQSCPRSGSRRRKSSIGAEA